MGKFLNKFKGGIEEVDNFANQRYNKPKRPNPQRYTPNNKKISDLTPDIDNFEDDNFDDDFYRNDPYFDEVGIQPAQKPESFHHFILENQYKDLERSIRGLKDVWDKEQEKWRTKRKEKHCFTDEEAEDILRLAQSHLATDIKLGRIRKEVFGLYMDAIYKEIAHLFESIAEYRYGRYGEPEVQYEMKLQNQKIFLELWSRIQANYSRSIEGQENKDTHGSVKGQESLQSGERDYTNKYKGYT